MNAAAPIEGDKSLLILDDDVAFRTRLARALEGRGFEVTSVGSVAEATEAAAKSPPAYAVLDLRLEDGSGLSVVEALSKHRADCRVVMLTGYGAIATAVESLKRGASDYLTKPVDADQVAAALDKEGASPDRAREFTVPSLARVEWEHIQRVMTECAGNVSQAARVLGLHRRSLQRKLSKYPVNR